MNSTSHNSHHQGLGFEPVFIPVLEHTLNEANVSHLADLVSSEEDSGGVRRRDLHESESSGSMDRGWQEG